MLVHNGMILWLTGVPAAGKTTIANLLGERLQAEGAKVHVLDGDVIRRLNQGRLGFSREERITHIIQVSNTTLMLKERGIICIVAMIAPYREIRQAILKKTGAIEIFVEASLETCRARDPKGLYSLAARGEIKNFTGIDDPYDPPLTPDIHLHTERETPEESAGRVLAHLQLRGYLDFQGEYLKIYQPYPHEKLLAWFPVPTLLLLRKKGSTKNKCAALWDDTLQFLHLRRYPYKHRILFLAGLPKSGTTWMRNLLCMVPGYHARTIYDPSRLVILHDISPLVFELMPRYGKSVIKLHTRYSPENFATICQYVKKFIVMYRDLRDMCVSRYFHVLNEESHRHHGLYKSLTEEEGILHSINIARLEYVAWVRDWQRIAESYPDRIIQVRYEDLHRDVKTTMGKVLAFFDIPYEQAMLESMEQSRLKTPVELKESLLRSDTKRKGIIGDWKNYFTPRLKDSFKEVAGELLVQLGYESDENW